MRAKEATASEGSSGGQYGTIGGRWEEGNGSTREGRRSMGEEGRIKTHPPSSKTSHDSEHAAIEG